ncbi:MAG: helix-turn-helix domain-containing protein [Burkholderiaceae bacterium]|jgi:AraC family transcriptional regulator of adaptative response / DNA-3-methyladenine glycosylase II|nr:MAG: helix-turn-helix domain-containing protein [Burkholderiaceae bacterium]
MARPVTALSPDTCYLALKARDARFDGRFFTGVTSTGVYCRPVCRVKTPRRENCRFFHLAAQAERAGFRPCLRCRPELAPQTLPWTIQDASSILAAQAARLLDDWQDWSAAAPSVALLAERVGVSDRHLRRIFEVQFGVSPLQYLQTRRLLAAKELLTDTDLPVTQIALASGFASLRRFNAAFALHYGLSPTRLRREGAGASKGPATVKLGYRPPYDAAAMLSFFEARALAGVEQVDAGGLTRTLRFADGAGEHSGWLRCTFDTGRNQVLLEASDSLQAGLPQLIRRVRAMLDLDADPEAINAVLHGDFAGSDGLRVPGTPDGYELAVRAVIGQQVTVAAARTLSSRLVQRFGEAIVTPIPGLDRLFPAPTTLAAASGDALGALGLVRQRQAAIHALARAVAEQRIALDAHADVPATIALLKELPGIGDWTAQYIAMRALRWPDAFPAGDVALQKALAVKEPSPQRAARAAEAASTPWQPWRSYAVIRAWSRLPEPVARRAATKTIA